VPERAAGCRCGGDGADGEGGHDQDGVPGDRGVETDLGLVEPEAVFAELEIFFDWPAQPGGADRPGRGGRLAFGQVAVAEGELAGGQVAADQQVMPGGGGAQPRPGVPALSLRSRPGRANLPAAPDSQPGGSLLAGERGPAGHGQPEAGGNPQHVGLVVVFQVLAQLSARAVDLIAAHEVQPHAVGEGLGRMSMASWPLVRKTRSSGRPMTADFAGSPMCPAGIHSRAPTSACPVPSRT
jgi:hypothetical protein